MKDIIIKNISKNFGEKTVFKNFNLIIPAGAITCIMGPSGSGKTTLINIIMGFIQPDEGSIEGIPDKISAVFQEDRLFENYSALSNASVAARDGIKKEDVIKCLSDIGLKGNEKKAVKELSGGMKRRVAIARAILSDYDLLILDEPFGGLDEETKLSVIKYVEKSIRGKTTIFITHNKTEAELFNAKIVQL